jgi:secretion/DNA translocation related TadE-like protein
VPAGGQGELGGASLLALALAAFLLLAGLLAVDVGALAAARAAAQNAADMAALAALTPSGGSPPARAAAIASANGAELAGCDCSAVQAVVTVRRRVALAPTGLSVHVTARARAVLATRPSEPGSVQRWAGGGPPPHDGRATATASPTPPPLPPATVEFRWRACPLREEVDLCLPLDVTLSLLGRESKGYLGRPSHPPVTTDLHGHLNGGVRLNSDLPRNARRSQTPLATRVDERQERGRGRVLLLRANQGHRNDGSIDRSGPAGGSSH